MISEPSACDGSTPAAHPEVMGADGICGFCPDTKSGADAGSPPPPHVREYCSICPIRLLRATLTVVVGTCGTMLLHTEKSNANPCLSYLSDHIRDQRFGIIQHQSPECHNPISCQPNYIFLSPQTAFHAHMPFEPPACERGHGINYSKRQDRVGGSD